ncbi:hypothetical protein [Pseudomonas sp. 1152_12]|uniref:hypothetical protein n=1 Tax=Pseudomonas sp. 1152_12 TaxID=2604455 RepID=UPI004063545E
MNNINSPSGQAGINPALVAQSTPGRWRTQLDNAFKSPGFLGGAKDQGLDTTELKLNPSTGELTGTVEKMPYASRRSPEALPQQHIALGDNVNTHALIKAPELQADDPRGRIDLSKVIVPTDPLSTYCRERDEPLGEVSVVDPLKAYALHVPKKLEQASNLANTLPFNLAHRGPGEHKGCAPFLIRSSDAAVQAQTV